jgi:Ca2+-binding RTX toxin-like protein
VVFVLTIDSLILEDIIMAIINDPIGNSNPKLVGTGELDIINGFDGDDYVFGLGGNDFIFGGDGSDVIQGDTRSYDLVGGNDYLDGGLGDDRLYGGGGDDRLIDLLGNNLLSGGAGNDVLITGAGNDVLSGDGGLDRLTGGLGRDYFALDGAAGINIATITDFEIGTDIIGIGIGLDTLDLVSNDATAAVSRSSLVYNTTTGNLFFNANGVSPGFGQSGGMVATLLNRPQNLTIASFNEI